MKPVSFEVAKYLKEIGYPQPNMDDFGYVFPCTCYFSGKYSYYDEYRERELSWDEENEFHTEKDWIGKENVQFYGTPLAAPTYLEVWVWLWREKNCYIQTLLFKDNEFKTYIFTDPKNTPILSANDPEEAIEKAINYLVENNLIK